MIFDPERSAVPLLVRILFFSMSVASIAGCTKQPAQSLDYADEIKIELNSTDVERRFAAVETLRSAGAPDELAKVLIEKLGDTDSRVRFSAAATLLKMVRKEGDLLQTLIQALPDINQAVTKEKDSKTQSIMLDLIEAIQKAAGLMKLHRPTPTGRQFVLVQQLLLNPVI